MRYPYYENMRQDVLALLPERPYDRILEVGGGEFPTLRSMAQSDETELWGCDVYKPKLPNIRFIHGSIESIDVQDQIPDAYFDLILANDVLEHLVDSEQFFATLSKKLKPGGLLACSVPNARQVRLIGTLLFKGVFPRQDSGLFDRTHLRWFCRKDVVFLGHAAGFSLLKAGASGKFVPKCMQQSLLAEFLALQNLFVFSKPVS